MMGITYPEGTARGPTGTEEQVNFPVDSGAQCSLLPRSVWESLGLEPKREQTFALADDQALLGVISLEGPALALNPFSRALHPMRLLL